MREPRTHFADLLYGRPCCGSDSKLVTRAEGEATCKRCQTVLRECAQGLSESAEREVRSA